MWDGLWYRRWKLRHTWIRNTLRMWKCPRIQNSMILSVFSRSSRNWYQIIWKLRNVKGLDSTSPSWKISTFLSDRSVKWMKAKVHAGKQLNNGKARRQPFEWKIPSMSYWEWMESQWSSNGWFFQDPPHCRFFTISKAIWRRPTSNRKSSVIESSSCPCSTT